MRFGALPAFGAVRWAEKSAEPPTFPSDHGNGDIAVLPERRDQPRPRRRFGALPAFGAVSCAEKSVEPPTFPSDHGNGDIAVLPERRDHPRPRRRYGARLTFGAVGWAEKSAEPPTFPSDNGNGDAVPLARTPCSAIASDWHLQFSACFFPLWGKATGHFSCIVSNGRIGPPLNQKADNLCMSVFCGMVNCRIAFAVSLINI